MARLPERSRDIAQAPHSPGGSARDGRHIAGVEWLAFHGQWEAFMTDPQGRHISVGVYETQERAAEAIQSMRDTFTRIERFNRREPQS